jgi:GTPase SAR1 family protein
MKRKLEIIESEQPSKKIKFIDDFTKACINSIHMSMIITGKSGCGKTTLLNSLIDSDFLKYYDSILHLSPYLEDFEYKYTDNKMYVNSNKRTDDELSEGIKKYSLTTGNKLIIFDDMATRFPKNDCMFKRTLDDIITQGRHHKLDYIILSQAYTDIPLKCRRNVNNIIVFKPNEDESPQVHKGLGAVENPKIKFILRNLEDNQYFYLNRDSNKRGTYVGKLNKLIKIEI